MPIYQFRCGACGEEFEDIVAYDAVAPCPACQDPNPARILSVFTAGSGRAAAPEVGAGASVPPAASGGTRMIDCSASGCKVGVKVGEGAVVDSTGLKLSGNKVGIENHGTFNGPDTKFE